MGGILRLHRQIWPRPIELAIPTFFLAAVAVVSIFYLALDYHRTYRAVIERYQAQAGNLAAWLDLRINRLAEAVRKSAGAPDRICSVDSVADFDRASGILPLAQVEVRDPQGVACAWQPRQAQSYFADCVPGTATRHSVSVSIALSDGWRFVSIVESACLFDAVVPAAGARDVQYRLVSDLAAASAPAAVMGPVRGPDMLSVLSAFSGTFKVAARSRNWPVSVEIIAPRRLAAREWMAALPLQLSLIGALSLALWFGPMRLVRKHISIEGQVKAALRRGDFFLAYLPTVELASRNWVGAEALLRWRHARYGVLMPGAFIPWIERSPRIHDTTRWVLIQAAQDLTRMSQLRPDFLLAVNLPPNQLSDHRLVDAVEEAFGSKPLSLCQVVFELTERQMVDYSLPSVRKVVAGLRARGAQFALDDFGVGFSNLSPLQQIDVDYVKIDQSFLRTGDRARSSTDLLEAMVNLARTLGVAVVVEGVETELELDRVRRLGVRFGQGFLFSRPLEIDALLARLSEVTPHGSPHGLRGANP